MTRQLPSPSSGQLSSYYLGFCLFHRLISDRLKGMEGLHWLLKLTPPEVQLFSTCRPHKILRESFKNHTQPQFVSTLTCLSLQSSKKKKKKSQCAIFGYENSHCELPCISGFNVRRSYTLRCESWAVDLWHSSRDLLAAAKTSRRFLGCRAPSTESERRSP